MRSRQHLWLTIAFILVLAVQLGTAWLVVDHARVDDEERIMAARVQHRLATAMASTPDLPTEPTQRDLAYQRQLHDVALQREQDALQDPTETVAAAVLTRDLASLADGTLGANPHPAPPGGPDQIGDPRIIPPDDLANLTVEDVARLRAGETSEYATGPDHAQHIRPVEPARNSMIITEPAQTFAFELDPSSFDDGICLLSNLSAGDYVVEVHGEDPANILINGQTMQDRAVDVHAGVTIQALKPVSILVRPGKVPGPTAPLTDG